METSSPNTSANSSNSTSRNTDPDNKYMIEERLTTVSSRGMAGPTVAEAPQKTEEKGRFTFKGFLNWFRNLFSGNK